MNNKTLEEHYLDQLTHLQQSSQHFAQQHPNIASQLTQTPNDPHIQQLLQANAYLNAIVQKKLDDQFPELTHELINILYPYYLKPTPSISIIQFQPDQSLTNPIKIPQHTTVQSQPHQGIKCTFQTTWDIHVNPITLQTATYEIIHTTHSYLQLQLTPNNQTTPLKNLDFFISNQNHHATPMSALLHHHLSHITLHTNTQTITVNKTHLQPIGLDPNHQLLPYPKNSLNAYGLLREYFIFEERLNFFKLTNLHPLIPQLNTPTLTIQFHFTHTFNTLKPLCKQDIALHSVPIVNLFEETSEPIKHHTGQSSLHITPSWKYQHNSRVYDIQTVIGLSSGSTKSIQYHPFGHFSKHANHHHFYTTQRHISNKTHEEELFINLIKTQKEPLIDTLYVTLQATNAHTPEKLSLGEINIPTQQTPPRTTFKNITHPTPMIQSPIDQTNLWFLVQHSTINILTITTLDQLKQILLFYAHSNNHPNTPSINQRKIDAITHFTLQPSTHLYKGTLLKGHTITLSLNHHHFINQAQMILFTHVLHTFFNLLAPINQTITLKAHNTTTGETITCQPTIRTTTTQP